MEVVLEARAADGELAFVGQPEARAHEHAGDEVEHASEVGGQRLLDGALPDDLRSPGTVRCISCLASSVVAVRSGTMKGVPGTTTGARVGTGSSAGFGCAPAGVASSATTMMIREDASLGLLGSTARLGGESIENHARESLQLKVGCLRARTRRMWPPGRWRALDDSGT